MGIAHATLGASNAHRWSVCGGSVKAEQGLGDKTSSFAQEGTAAHELGEICLKSGDDPADWGYVGDLFHVDSVLERLCTFLGGEDVPK